MKMRLIRSKEYLGLVVLFALGISGCYTVLKHPEVVMKDDSDTGYRAAIGYRDECSSCHTERYSDNTYDHDVALFGNPSLGDDGTINGEQNRAITTHGRRWNYYHYPWWYDYTRGGTIQSGGGSGKTSVDNQNDDSRRSIGSQRGSSPNTINIPPPARSVPSTVVHQPAVKTRRVHRRRKTHGGQYGRTRPVIQGTTVTLQIYVLTMLKETRVQTMARAIAEAREQAGQQEENSLWRECYSLIHDDSSLHKLDR